MWCGVYLLKAKHNNNKNNYMTIYNMKSPQGRNTQSKGNSCL